MGLHPVIGEVTLRLERRSAARRSAYLKRLAAAGAVGPRRGLSCGNLAHAFAASEAQDKATIRAGHSPNIGIVTAYNDMLSAHQPYEGYPERIRRTTRLLGASAQVAGGVPAMCDGVTQGRPGMELSLFSRDVIALSTAIALSHDVFDAAVYLGICDKIVPGLLIGALSFGHLPAVFIPSGPMRSGMPNADKSRVRQRYATGDATREELLDAEARSYHSAGTCTFYGTANSNQMLMEIMGLQLPGSSFVNPQTPLRDALTQRAVERAVELARTPVGLRCGELVDARTLVNGVVGLHATGGSTNHLLHLVAIAAAAGLELTLEDIARLSDAVPLLARVYPNGTADINSFHCAGGMAFIIAELLDAGRLHADARTILGGTLADYTAQPYLDAGVLRFSTARAASQDESVLRSASTPFQDVGGLRMLTGNLGTAAIKLSAVAPERWLIEAPALVVNDLAEVNAHFEAGQLDRDFVLVVPFQGPRANGMPELHSLTPLLGVLQDRGHRVALVTDGRMSGASGRVPAAIHLSPEAMASGPLARVHSGDPIRLDARRGTLNALVDDTAFAARSPQTHTERMTFGLGRELFELFRRNVGAADRGASIFGDGA
jgi:phosphogluconate dehydratase